MAYTSSHMPLASKCVSANVDLAQTSIIHIRRKRTAMKQPDPQQSTKDTSGVGVFLTLKRELGFESSEKLIKAMGCLIRQLGKTIPTEKAHMMINKLPDFFRMIFIDNWRQEDAGSRKVYLDEFVEEVYIDDQRSQKIFRTEIMAMSFVLAVLSKFDLILRGNGITIIPEEWRYSMQRSIPNESTPYP